MRETVIIFDGVSVQEIGAPYFFQDRRIKDLNKDQVLKKYIHTLYYLKLLKDIRIKNLGKLERGLAILKQMVLDMHGDVNGNVILIGLDNKLKLID
jgi:hypothetical protein